jgi:hypothetical protein
MFSITEIINVDEKSDPQNKDRNTINGYILVHFFVYVYIYIYIYKRLKCSTTTPKKRC